MNIVFGGSSAMRGVTSEQDFSLTVNENPAIAAPVYSPFVDRDANFSTITGSLTANNFIISVTPSLVFPGTPVFESVTPDTATVDAAGAVTRVADGDAKILVRFPSPLGVRGVARRMSATGSTTAKYFQSFVSGTLGAHVNATMTAMVSGKTPSDTTKNLFTSNNYSLSAPAAVRNPNVFTGSIDLSAISIINGSGSGGYIHPAMLISPRHIIGATHYQPGSTVVFMGADGVMQVANVISRQNHVGSALTLSGYTDIQVAYLDRAITGITPFKTLPGNWRTYLPTGHREVAYGSSEYKTIKLAALTKTAHNSNGGNADQISITEVIELNDTDYGLSAVIYNLPFATVLPTQAWHSPTIGGDSGGPVFILVDGSLVLLMCWWVGGGGTNLADMNVYINAAMNSLATAAGDPAAGTYALSHPDLSGFTSY